MKTAVLMRPWAIADGITLTKNDAELLAYIVIVTRSQGFPPTVREMVKALCLSHKPIQDRLKRLQAAGCIDWVPRRPRSIYLLIPVKIAIGIPCET
jgi:SOS-response transcriptional repressor LexA